MTKFHRKLDSWIIVIHSCIFLPRLFKNLVVFHLFILFAANSIGQDSLAIFLIGNTADRPSTALYDVLSEEMTRSSISKKYLLGTGDYISGNYPLNTEDVPLVHLQQMKKTAESSFLLSGDRDWGNSDYQGLKIMKNLDKYFQKENHLDKGLELDEGCPGPSREKLSEYCVLILINSQWFIHPHDKPISSDNDCDLFNEEDFWEALEEMIEEESGKRIIIAAHHNIYGHGDYSGKMNYTERWTIPLFGHFIADYKKNVGRPKDFAYDSYADYRNRMQDLLANYNNVIYISGHEHTSEVLRENGNIYLNSGAMGINVVAHTAENQIYRGKNRETYKILINKNRDAVVDVISETGKQIQLLVPWNLEKNFDGEEFQAPIDSGKYIAGPEYRAGDFKRFWMGDHYRKEWTTSVRVPRLWLDSINGGLVPYAKGGGLQTAALKLKSPDGQKFSFRSVNKNPEKALDKKTRETIYRHIVKDLITTQHPYGGLVASDLLDKTDILHVNPELYYLPDQDALGDFRRDFSGTLGTLELRPDADSPGFSEGIEDIVSTHIMYRKLINEDDHIVDKMAYAKARVFDMWVGDWDRHQDNWKWAEIKKKGSSIYKPIPRDRDHVFSQWEGIIPKIADWVVPNAEHFGTSFGNVKHLNWKARHLDRFVGNELTLDDWIDAARYLQSRIDSSDIENAISKMPNEVVSISGNDIKQKLISRLNELPHAVKKHFKTLANEVNIVGSNKKDDFEIISQENGGLEVKIYDNKNLTYQRVFDPGYTKKIYIYGLGKKDEFKLKGKYKSDIKIKIIGGKGSDLIIDENEDAKNDVKVYDFFGEDELIGPNLNRIKSHRDPEFNVNEFEFPSILPFLGLKSSSGNGLGVQFTMEYKKNIFNKPDFGRISNVDMTYFPGLKAYLLDLDHKYRYFWGRKDLLFNLIFSTYYSDYPFFYGIGNNTIRDHEFYEDGFYRIDYNTLKTNIGFSKSFWQQSNFSYYAIFEYNKVEASDDEFTLLALTEEFYYGLGSIVNYGLGTDLNIDMRDSKLFTRHGSLLKMSLKAYNNKNDFFAKFHGHVAKYSTYNLFGPTTFILATGIYHTFGEAPFYMQSSLGSNTNLRGHVRNRYVDRSAFYYNTEMRMHLGTLRTVLTPIRFGTFLFHDSGKVFNGDFTLKNGMHSTYGVGLYFAPLSDDYSFTISFAESEDRNTYVRMDFGWEL